ncbi:hypothetical protein T01_2277 [Trichinella spiralis]|uniref:Uncharacterized protein n=1 Tax=Trichinella spiralis TaxID=6334 RepID=A0A0V1B372_TRISP|nr:hypothetical protein T01_2277 [Trichinella spiralis]
MVSIFSVILSVTNPLQEEKMGMYKVRIVSLSPKTVSKQDGIVEVPEETDCSGITSVNKKTSLHGILEVPEETDCRGITVPVAVSSKSKSRRVERKTWTKETSANQLLEKGDSEEKIWICPQAKPKAMLQKKYLPSGYASGYASGKLFIFKKIAAGYAPGYASGKI